MIRQDALNTAEAHSVPRHNAPSTAGDRGQVTKYIRTFTRFHGHPPALRDIVRYFDWPELSVRVIPHNTLRTRRPCQSSLSFPN
jgi:hypothetical protein